MAILVEEDPSKGHEHLITERRIDRSFRQPIAYLWDLGWDEIDYNSQDNTYEMPRSTYEIEFRIQANFTLANLELPRRYEKVLLRLG